MGSLRWSATLSCVLGVNCLACQQRVLLGYEEHAAGPSGAGGAALTDSASTGEPEPTAPVGVPERGEVQWRADVETGDLTQWTDDGQGYDFQVAEAHIAPGTEHSRSGAYALEATIEAVGDVLPQAVMFRTGDLLEGFYSAWYFLGENYAADFWVIMNFQGDRPWQGQPTNDRFDIDLSRSPDDDRLHLELDEFGGSSTLSPIPVPIDAWFQVEVFYRSTPDENGRLVVWQDGELVFDTGERPTAPSSMVGFGVGAAAWRVAPLPATIWIDDVEIRATRQSTRNR